MLRLVVLSLLLPVSGVVAQERAYPLSAGSQPTAADCAFHVGGTARSMYGSASLRF
jgi:hypothetical protein